MGSYANVTEKPHAVCIPFPAQGHVSPMLKLAKLLYSRGFHITFVNSEYNHARLIKSVGSSSLNDIPDFQFKTIPDGLPLSDEEGTQDIPSLFKSTMITCLGPLSDLLTGLKGSDNVPPVSCIVADSVMTFTLDAAEEIGVPLVLFSTPSACASMATLRFRELLLRGVIPLKEISYFFNGYLDTPIDWIPGMPNLRLKFLPSFIRITNPEDFMLNFLIREAERASRASAIILNTFETLEGPVLKAISEEPLPPVYSIGPLSLLLQKPIKSPLSELGSSLWKEDQSCLDWLNSRENPKSVVYVNFGSIMVLTKEQLVELAWGLSNTNYDFLWVIRPDLVKGELAVLAEEFLREVQERGKIASWCPQEKVLNHSSVGCFLTHSGWNSTLESISAGVPMLCLPFFADQQTNCFYACSEWGIGKEIEGEVKREKVESLIVEVMEGKEGMEMKKRAGEWKERAIEATRPGGSSEKNFDSLVRMLRKSGESD